MSILKVSRLGHPVLRERAADVEIADIKAGKFRALLDDMITDWEGCLSVPFLGGEVARAKKIRLRAVDHDGDPVDVEVSGFTARIFQHEVDHTDGNVYLDRMPDLRTLGYTIVL